MFNRRNLIYLRSILSTFLIIVSSILGFTGIGLYFSPSGRIARETGWSFFGLSKFKLENLHTKMGFIFLALLVLHLVLNFTMYKQEILGSYKFFLKNYGNKSKS